VIIITIFLKVFFFTDADKMHMSGGVYLRVSRFDRIFHNSLYITHDHPLQLAYPDVFSLIRELLSGDGCDSSNPLRFQLFSFLIVDLFILDIKGVPLSG
jgi:hypothetical protein